MSSSQHRQPPLTLRAFPVSFAKDSLSYLNHLIPEQSHKHIPSFNNPEAVSRKRGTGVEEKKNIFVLAGPKAQTKHVCEHGAAFTH